MTVATPSVAVPSLAIVVPCYNEEESLPKTIQVLNDLLDRLIAANKITAESKNYFVDDGSRDKTWEILHNTALKNPKVVAIKL
jgi:polyisoprenyl-phosphate glycosyltransferase